MPENQDRVEVNFLRCILESIAIFYLSEKSNKILFFGMLLVGGRIQCSKGLSEVHTCLLGPLAFAYHLLTGDAETEYSIADLGVELTKRYPSERYQCISNYFFAFNCHTRKTQYDHHEVFEKSLKLAIRSGEHCWGSLSCGFGSTITVDLGIPVERALSLLRRELSYCESINSERNIFLVKCAIEVFNFAKGDAAEFKPEYYIPESEIDKTPWLRYCHWQYRALCKYFVGEDEEALAIFNNVSVMSCMY
jgi:hypothetical protein